jgi:hypothetical protein
MQTEQRQKIPRLQNQVVVFSKNYLPLARINLKRAFTPSGNCFAPCFWLLDRQRLWSSAALSNGKSALPVSYYKFQITSG